MKLKKIFHNWGKPVLIAFAIALPIKWAVADQYIMRSAAMSPAIDIGDRIFVNKAAYSLRVPFTTKHILSWSEPRCGDVVMFKGSEGKTYARRVTHVGANHVCVADNGEDLTIKRSDIVGKAVRVFASLTED